MRTISVYGLGILLSSRWQKLPCERVKEKQKDRNCDAPDSNTVLMQKISCSDAVFSARLLPGVN